jgi:SAM-dependent methyltransferase
MSTTADFGRRLEEIYSGGTAVRIARITAPDAEALCARTLRFVGHFATGGTVLDVGCGSGWLTYLLARRGFEATGIDLGPTAFEPPPLPNLHFRQGSALHIPFADAAFDVVMANTMLEHTDRPREVLLEMKRVLKPGGLLFITGPNLVALGPSLRLLVTVWRRRSFREIFLWSPEMQSFPYGSTLPEILGALLRNLVRIPIKLLWPAPSFEFRVPEYRPPFHADNDAIYLCCPADICRFLKRQGFKILRNVDLGRPRVTLLLAGGTWVAARQGGGAPC